MSDRGDRKPGAGNGGPSPPEAVVAAVGRGLDASLAQLEELAAFADGRLQGEARQRVVEYLATDEGYYETYVDMLRDEDEVSAEPSVAGVDGQVLRPARWRRLWPLLPLAAGVLFVVGLVFGPLRSDRSDLLAGLVNAGERTEGLADLQDAGYKVYRSNQLSENFAPGELAFRLGDRLLLLRAALRSGEGQIARRQLGMSASLAEALGISGVGIALDEIEKGLEAASEIGTSLTDLEVWVGEAEATIYSQLLEEELPYYQLGALTTAGRLAMKQGRDAYFLRKEFGQEVAVVQKSEMPSGFTDRLSELQASVERRPPDLQRVEELLEELHRNGGEGAFSAPSDSLPD